MPFTRVNVAALVVQPCKLFLDPHIDCWVLVIVGLAKFAYLLRLFASSSGGYTQLINGTSV